MGFLDNLENDLKNLERADEKDTRAERQRRDEERARALAVAPYADKLRNGPFVNEFLSHATRMGHANRTRVAPTWVGNVLRVEAREKRIEFRPAPDGVVAAFFERGQETASERVDLDTGAAELARRWLG